MNKYIWIYHTIVIRLLEHKLMLFGVIGFVVSIKFGLFCLYTGFILDMLTALLIATHVHIKTAKALKTTLQSCNFKFKNYTHPLLENIISYFADYNLTVKFREKIAKRELFVAKVDSQVGGLYSFPFMFGKSVILLPVTFDETELRDRVLFAHEYSHCISHDMIITLADNIKVFSIIIFGLGIITTLVTGVCWTMIVSIFISLLLLVGTKLSSLTKIETEANSDCMAYVKQNENLEDHTIQKIVLLLFKSRLNSLLTPKCKMYSVKFFSELNQIYELITMFNDNYLTIATQSINEKHYVDANIKTKSYLCKLRVISLYLKRHGVCTIGRQRLAIERPLLILFPLIFAIYIYYGLLIVPFITPMLQCNFMTSIIVLTIFFVVIVIFLNILNTNIWKNREKALSIGTL